MTCYKCCRCCRVVYTASRGNETDWSWPLSHIDPPPEIGPRLTLFLQQQPLSCWIDLISGYQWLVYQDNGASFVSQVKYGPMLASESGYVRFRVTYRKLSDYIYVWGLFWARHHCGTLSSAVILVCNCHSTTRVIDAILQRREGACFQSFPYHHGFPIVSVAVKFQGRLKTCTVNGAWCIVLACAGSLFLPNWLRLTTFHQVGSSNPAGASVQIAYSITVLWMSASPINHH